jgi:hypothetical protein
MGVGGQCHILAALVLEEFQYLLYRRLRIMWSLEKQKQNVHAL